jgi:hypothetical protein
VTPEDRERVIERNTRRNWKQSLRAAPILVIGIPAILLSEHYLGPFWRWLAAAGLLAGMLTYVHFLPQIPDE